MRSAPFGRSTVHSTHILPALVFASQSPCSGWQNVIYRRNVMLHLLEKNINKLYNGIMKKIILFVMSIFGISSIPLILFTKSDIIIKLLQIDSSQFFNLILTILPIVFSLILVAFNYMLDYIKKQKEIKAIEKDEINRIIYQYNVIMLKTSTNHILLKNELDKILKVIHYLKDNPIFLEIMNIWEKETGNTIDLSNDSNFRAIIRERLNDLIVVYRTNFIFDHHLEYLSNLDPIFSKYNIFTIEDRVFIYNLRNYIAFTEEEKNIINIYSDLFNNGGTFNRICNELILAINDLHGCFENEIRTRKIDDKKLHSLLYHLFTKLFHYSEILLREIYFMESFENIFFEKFNSFHNEKSKKNKNLNEYIKFEKLYQNKFIDKYINEKIMYEYYNISK
jgi:hypothetical protein